MPDEMTLVIVGAVWAALLALVWALCVAAGRADARAEGRLQQPARRPAVVADTGAIREQLMAALRIMDAEQLSVTVTIDGRDAVLASARPVLEAQAGTWPELAVPVRVAGRSVAMLRAFRRPGENEFDAADMLLLTGVARGLTFVMQTAHPSTGVPVRAPTAMA